MNRRRSENSKMDLTSRGHRDLRHAEDRIRECEVDCCGLITTQREPCIRVRRRIRRDAQDIGRLRACGCKWKNSHVERHVTAGSACKVQLTTQLDRNDSSFFRGCPRLRRPCSGPRCSANHLRDDGSCHSVNALSFDRVFRRLDLVVPATRTLRRRPLAFLENSPSLYFRRRVLR
jgi:hypothetical protein